MRTRDRRAGPRRPPASGDLPRDAAGRASTRTSSRPGAELDGVARDPELRAALFRELARRRVLRGGALVLEELGLRRSDAVIDVAVVRSTLEGFEIKSDADSLRRLERQAVVYGQIFDRMTLVAGERHLDAARALLPPWWGLLAARSRAGEVVLTTVREGRPNPDRQARALAELLWLEEARALLGCRGALRGYRTKPRDAVWDRVCEVLSLEELGREVRRCLKARAAAGSLEPSS